MRTVIIIFNDLQLFDLLGFITPGFHFPLFQHVPAPSKTRPNRLPGITLTVALHAAIIAGALSYAPARQTLLDLAPVMVSLLPQQEQAKPEQLPKPKPVVKQAYRKVDPSPQTVLTSMEAAPTASANLAPPPPADPRPAEPVAAAQPAPVAPPRFNADYLNNPAPQYPAVSRRLREEGRVTLRVFVDVQGLPARIELRTSSGYERLDHIALETVRQWKFIPARRGDEAVSAWVLVPISFSLRS